MKLALAVLLLAGTAVGQTMEIGQPLQINLPEGPYRALMISDARGEIATCDGTVDALTDCVLAPGRTLTEALQVMADNFQDRQKRLEKQRAAYADQLDRDIEAIARIQKILKPKAPTVTKGKR